MNLLERFQESSAATCLRLLWDLIVVNLLWILFCIPIITMGPATCALFSVTMKLPSGENVPIVKEFLHAVCSNFKQGIVHGLAAAALLVVAGVDAVFALQQRGLAMTTFLVTSILVTSVGLTYICYVFPLQARFCNKVSRQIKNAFILAFCNPIKTILMWLICVVPVAAAALFPGVMIKYLGFLYMMMGVSLPAYCISWLLHMVINKLNTQQKQDCYVREESVK